MHCFIDNVATISADSESLTVGLETTIDFFFQNLIAIRNTKKFTALN